MTVENDALAALDQAQADDAMQNEETKDDKDAVESQGDEGSDDQSTDTNDAGDDDSNSTDDSAEGDTDGKDESDEDESGQSESEPEDEGSDAGDEDSADDKEEAKEAKSSDDVSQYDTAEEYMRAKLPELKVWGQEGDDGEVKEFTIKTAADLPDDFIPRSYKEQQLISEQLSRQAGKAEKLVDEYNEGITAAHENAYREQIEKSWMAEIEEATAEGRIPKITTKENTPGFADDAGVKRVAEVMDFMQKENDRLAKIGSPFRVQSVKHALDLMDAQAKTKEEETKTQAEANLTKKRGSLVGSGAGSTAEAKPVGVAPGTTIEDILNQELPGLE